MDYKDFNDYELLYLIEENNDQAQDILYQKYLPILRRLTLKYYRGLKEFGVTYDDLFQEAYLTFLQTIKLFNEKEDTLFYTYLVINVCSKLSNYARITTSQKNLFYTNMLSLDFRLSPDDNNTLADCVECYNQEDPLTLLEYNDTLQLLRKFNLELKPLQSQIFELLCGGFNNRDIASLLDICIKEVSNTIYRIRKRLKLYLASSQL